MPRPQINQQTTVFAFGEGESERIFLKYIRSLYAQGKTRVQVSDAGGKAPSYIVRKAIRTRQGLQFDHSFILFDEDIPWKTSLIQKAELADFELIGSKPCLEGMLLSVLDSGQSFDHRTSVHCKREFCNRYLGRAGVMTLPDYEKILPKEVIESEKARVPSLFRIIEITLGHF